MKPNAAPILPYSLRRSERAKNTRIVVKPDKIEVVAPLKVSDRKIHAFVEAQQDWIRAAMLRVAEKARTVPSLAPDEYADGMAIPYRGRQLPMQIELTKAKLVRIQLQADSFLVNLPSHADQEQRSELVRQAFIRWMKNQARLEANIEIEKHAPRFALFPKSLRIKTQKSRWGSCGPNNDINLNWLLMLAPPAVLEYVIVHELCHIKHKNHSQDFWRLVEKHLPDYPERRRWLKQNGSSLMKGL